MIPKPAILLLYLSFFSFSGTFQRESDQQEINQKFTNPVFDGADPWIIKKDDFYYYCFSSANGINISRSLFLTKKGETKRVWSAPASGWNKSCVWAPEIHFFNGHWYIYYAAGESGPPYNHQRSGVLMSENEDVFSEYSDMGMLYTGDDPEMKNNNIWAVDLTVFEWKGTIYAVWSGWKQQAETDKTSQHLYIAEMSDPCHIRKPRIFLSSPAEVWETGGPLDLQEGPEILKHGGDLFIVYSCRESWTTDYRLGLLKLRNSAGSPLDPGNWEKTGPVFSGPYGTGHCSFATSPDGKEDWIIYHSKKNKTEGWQRDIRMQSYKWSKDGFPLFGDPVPAGVEIFRPSGEFKIETGLLKKQI